MPGNSRRTHSDRIAVVPAENVDLRTLSDIPSGFPDFDYDLDEDQLDQLSLRRSLQRRSRRGSVALDASLLANLTEPRVILINTGPQGGCGGGDGMCRGMCYCPCRNHCVYAGESSLPRRGSLSGIVTERGLLMGSSKA